MLAAEDGALAAALDPAGIAGVPIEDAVGALVAGQLHLFGIDDDDMIAAIHVRRVARLMLAAQPRRDQRRGPAASQTGSAHLRTPLTPIFRMPAPACSRNHRYAGARR